MIRIVFVVFVFLLYSCKPERETIKPNLLLILTDDQGFGDVGLHGNDTVETPNMDFLGEEGIQLTHFFVSPVCAPTRASLLTGRYHYRTGTSWVTRNAEAMHTDETTLAELFQANQYETGCFGKWHNGAHYPQNPLGQGFDNFTGFSAGHLSNYFDPVLEKNGKQKKFTGYINDIVTREAIEFVEASGDNPFFCYVPFNTPHTPYILPDKLYTKYVEKGCSAKLASTYGMVENIDQNIGKMIRVLDSLGKLDNTLIVFMTDNGPNYDRYNAGLKGRKGWVNDGGVRVPCYFYWKNSFKSNKVNTILSHIDVYKTIEELFQLGTIETKPQDGNSFASLLTDENPKWPNRNLYTFSMNFDKFRGAVRNQDWRLTIEQENQYQLSRISDESESTDLKAEFPEIARSLYAGYLEKYDEVISGLEGFLPIPIGYSKELNPRLLTHESYLTGEVKYRASRWGWAHDWITGWSSENDTVYWEVDVAEKADYEIIVRYNASITGAKVKVSSKSVSSSSVIGQKTQPEIIPNYEKVPRDVEAFEQTWGKIKLDPISLTPQDRRIYLTVEGATNTMSLEIKEIDLVHLN